MNNREYPKHLSAERMQAFLEGGLSPGERTGVEGHLASCARCSGEMDAWRLLFERLQDLPVLTPERGFTERVLSGVSVSEPLSWAARVRSRVSTVLEGPLGNHVGAPELQDYVDGMLPAGIVGRVEKHLHACPDCAGEAASLRSLVTQLDGIGHLAPAEGFAQRVMDEVRVPAAAVARQRTPEWRRALAAFGRLIPKSQQAWATLSGVAVTPVVTVGLMVWTVFTHPTLTPSALASFAWWKVSDLAAVAWQAMASAALESSGLFGAFSLFESLTLSPAALAGAFLTLSLGTVSAAWVLYRNLIATHPSDGRYAHASIT